MSRNVEEESGGGPTPKERASGTTSFIPEEKQREWDKKNNEHIQKERQKPEREDITLTSL